METAKQLDLFSNEAQPKGLHLCSVKASYLLTPKDIGNKFKCFFRGSFKYSIAEYRGLCEEFNCQLFLEGDRLYYRSDINFRYEPL